MKRGPTRTLYLLSPLDKLCFVCTLDWCDDGHPQCLRRLARKAGDVSDRKPSFRRFQVLSFLAEQGAWYSVVDIAKAIDAPRSTITHVLLKLRQEGRVEEKGRGRALRLRGLPLFETLT